MDLDNVGPWISVPYIFVVLLQISSPQVSENCNSLEAELDHVKLEIVKMMNEKEQKSKEANQAKSYEMKISELEKQNIQLKKEILILSTSNKTKSCNNLKSEETLCLPDILADRSPPDGEEREDDCVFNHCLTSSPSFKIETEMESNSQENYNILEEKK